MREEQRKAFNPLRSVWGLEKKILIFTVPIFIYHVIFFRGIAVMQHSKGHAQAIVNGLLDVVGLAEAGKTPTINGAWWYLSIAIFSLCSIR